MNLDDLEGICVTTIQPGAVATEFSQVAGRKKFVRLLRTSCHYIPMTLQRRPSMHWSSLSMSTFQN